MAPRGEVDWDALDAIWSTIRDIPDSTRWLFDQTVNTATSRRGLLSVLAVEPGARVLDIGCGYGAGAVELAVLRGVEAIGMDLDRQVLTLAGRVAQQATDQGIMPSGSSVRFCAGDVYRIPCRDEAFDLVVARYLFQHLPTPEAAVAEIHRVLRPGGRACLVDVDDGLWVRDPPVSGGYRRLLDALTAAQHAVGGDRLVGRKLASYLNQAGFDLGGFTTIPETAFGWPEPDGPARTTLGRRLLSMREQIVSLGLMSPSQFDADFTEYATDRSGPVSEINAQVVAVGFRR